MHTGRKVIASMQFKHILSQNIFQQMKHLYKFAQFKGMFINHYFLLICVIPLFILKMYYMLLLV